jgi:hypothetical protein
VAEGTTNADKLFVLSTNDPITVGTTALTFTLYDLSGGLSDHNHTGGGDGGDLSGSVVSNYLDFTEGSAPGTPASGKARLYVKTDGLFYSKDDAGAESGLSGGGGGTVSDWDPFTLLTPPPVLSNWAWVNQGGATAVDLDDGIVLTAPSNSGDSFRILKKAVPSAPYTIVLGYIATMVSANYYITGFVWRQSSDGKIIAFGLSRDNATKFRVVKYNSVSSISSEYVGYDVVPATSMVWLKIEDDNTNRKCSFSFDSKNWLEIHSVGRTDFLTADEVGFCVNVNNTSLGAIMSLISWEQS